MSYLQSPPQVFSQTSSNPVRETGFGQSSGLQFFIDFICVLEGTKTKIKNLHWSAKRLPNADKRGAHLYLDEFLSIVSDFQDTVAESSQGILGIMDMNCVSGVSLEVGSPKDLMDWLRGKTVDFYGSIPEDTVYVGIKAETETFIKDITKYCYLFQLTE